MPDIQIVDAPLHIQEIMLENPESFIVPETAYFMLNGKAKALIVPKRLQGHNKTVFTLIKMWQETFTLKK